MTKANYSLRLQPSLKAAAEKLSALDIESYFKDRAEGSNRADSLAYLNGAQNEPPREGDQI